MKLNELISDFTIYTTNEEKKLLDRLKNPCYIDIFTEREQVVLNNLVRKSIVSKVNYKGAVLVVGNDKPQ
jgi:predicted restriction endonuclease